MPPGGGVVIKMHGDVARLMGDMRKLEAAYDKQEAKLRGLQRSGKKAGTDASAGFQMAKTAVKGLVVGLVGSSGLMAAYRLVSAELRNIIALQKESSTEQLSAASARKGLIRNLPGLNTEEVKAVLATATGIARTTKVDQKFIDAAFASAVSASGGDVPRAEAAVRQASKFLADRPGDIPLYAGAFVDISKVTGTTDAEVNQGYLAAVAGMSRVTEATLQAKNIPTALVGMRTAGATRTGAAAAYAALTTGGADLTGERSGTAGIRLAQQLQEFEPGRQTMGSMIGKLQADPRLAQQFLDKATFEGKVEGPIIDLLTNAASETAKAFAKNLTLMPDDAGLRAKGQQMIANFMADPLEAGARMDRAFKTAASQMLLGNIPGGQAGITREGLVSVLHASGMGKMAEKWVRAQFELGTGFGRRDPTGAAIELLGRRERQLSAPTETRFRRTGSMMHGGGVEAFEVPRDPTEIESLSAELLRELITEVKAVRAAEEDQAAQSRTVPERSGPHSAPGDSG